MNSSTNNNHQQIDITEGTVDKQRTHITGTQIDNEKGLQIDDGLINIESRAWIDSGETDCESGVQTDSKLTMKEELSMTMIEDCRLAMTIEKMQD